MFEEYALHKDRILGPIESAAKLLIREMIARIRIFWVLAIAVAFFPSSVSTAQSNWIDCCTRSEYACFANGRDTAPLYNEITQPVRHVRLLRRIQLDNHRPGTSR